MPSDPPRCRAGQGWAELRAPAMGSHVSSLTPPCCPQGTRPSAGLRAPTPTCLGGRPRRRRVALTGLRLRSCSGPSALVSGESLPQPCSSRTLTGQLGPHHTRPLVSGAVGVQESTEASSSCAPQALCGRLVPLVPLARSCPKPYGGEPAGGACSAECSGQRGQGLWGAPRGQLMLGLPPTGGVGPPGPNPHADPAAPEPRPAASAEPGGAGDGPGVVAGTTSSSSAKLCAAAACPPPTTTSSTTTAA